MNKFSALEQKLKVDCELLLAQGKLDAALFRIHNFVEWVVTDPSNTAKVFGSAELDRLCVKIGTQSLKNLLFTNQHVGREVGSRSTAIYIVSRLQRSGGHSKLLQDFIRAQPDTSHMILSTEVGGPSDREFFQKKFSTENNIEMLFASGGDFRERLLWLQATLLERRPDHVHLLNHHQDSVAVAALAPQLGLEGSFYHHGDHHLCLGVYCDHLKHVDLHPMGYHHCRDVLLIKNHYLPLTVEDKGWDVASPNQKKDVGLTTATAARYNKVEPMYYVSYLDVIPRVLEATGGQHVHIGNLTPWALHKICKNMKKRGIDRDRFVYIKWTPSVWRTLQEHLVDVYISSFPYPAGLTLIEAMGAGVPVVMHRHAYSRVLSALELAYPEAFSWTEPEDLLEHLAKLTRNDLKSEGLLARNQYLRFHLPVILREYFDNPSYFSANVPSLDNRFMPIIGKSVHAVDAKVGLPHLLFLFFYRRYRKMRNSTGVSIAIRLTRASEFVRMCRSKLK